MKVCLAGVESVETGNQKLLIDRFTLISFFSVNNNSIGIIKNSSFFLLDSGAFSFMKSSDHKVDWEEYIKMYADFINKNNIEHFFELDIDNVVGYAEVLRLRKMLEELTHKKCIPVWHKSRGMSEYSKMLEEYDYVAIGGIVTREIKPEQYRYFPKLISEAHKKGTKVHGLGFTSTKLLKQIHFDSVDSTNWSYGRYGHYWEFTKKQEMVMHHRPLNKRCGDRSGLQRHNLEEWIKFQKYADSNL